VRHLPRPAGAHLRPAEGLGGSNGGTDQSPRPSGGSPVGPAGFDDGTGNAVIAVLRRDGYRCSAIGAGTSANRADLYPRKRDELWFEVAERAKSGQVFFGQLDRTTLCRLKHQLMTPARQRRGQGRPAPR
jgi:hypothetical protein